MIRKLADTHSMLDFAMTTAAIALAIFMVWSLWSLSNSPLNTTQRLWWVFAVLILPGIGSFAWWWWIKRYYPRRKRQDPAWDPALKPDSQVASSRPRPGRGRYQRPGE